MYELYDKNGNQIGYRMTKRIKNEDGKYDVLLLVQRRVKRIAERNLMTWSRSIINSKKRKRVAVSSPK